MEKIYRRDTQLGGTPKRKKDEKARKRNKIMNFRVSENERRIIEDRIAVTGMKKSSYFIQSCMYQKILVRGNIRSFSAMRDAISEFKDEVMAVDTLSEIDTDKLESFRMVLEILAQAPYTKGD